jgi:DNA-directed RNA polymerase subunit K/omega
MTESRARYISEEAANMVGNRFDLVLIASQRVSLHAECRQFEPVTAHQTKE